MLRAPSTMALICFEASARHASFTRAADELSLTQGAVSRQVISLESRLGLPLFVRHRHALELTPAGRAYLEDVRPALAQLERATSLVRALKGQGGKLNLSVGSSFANHWLIPRLPQFVRAHPEITLNLATRIGPADFSSGAIDASLEYGSGDRPGLKSQFVMPLQLSPYAAPQWIARRGLVLDARTPSHELIHHTTVPEAWLGWFEQQGIPYSMGTGAPRYDLMSMVLNAAMVGLGAVLLPAFMVQEAVASGRLVRLSTDTWTAARAYYLIYPGVRAEHSPMATFREWLLEEVKASV